MAGDPPVSVAKPAERPGRACRSGKGQTILDGNTLEHDRSDYLALIRRNRNFRRLWFGQIVSLLGDWFSLVASATLIASLTQSGLAVGFLFIVRMLPPFFVSPFAGVAADRRNRKHLLVLTDLLRFAVTLGFLLVRTESQIWLLYTLTATQFAISGFFFPTRNAILPDLVRPEELGAANALSGVTWSVMLALGAALGGIVAGKWGIYTAFVVDSLTYLLSAFILSGIAYAPPRSPESDRSSRAVTQFLEGLAYLKNHPDTLFVAMHKSLFALAMGGALQVIHVELAQSVYVIGEGGSISLGWMYATAGVGTAIGPLFSRRFTHDRAGGLRRSILVAYLIAVCGVCVMAPLASFGLVLLGIFLRGVGGGINWVFSTQLLMIRVPERVRGRVFSTEFALFTLSVAIGTAIGGFLIDHTGWSLTGIIFLLAGFLTIPALTWGWWLRRTTTNDDKSGEKRLLKRDDTD